MGMKRCPYCFEKIQKEAILCKHCKSRLENIEQTKDEIPPSDSSSISNDKKSKKENNSKDHRTLELVLGLLGGIGGIISGVTALFFGGVAQAFEVSGSGLIGNLGLSAIGFSILGIVGSIMVKKNGKLGGLFMTIAAVCGFISVFIFYILPGILLLIPGIMSLKKKGQEGIKTKWKIWIPVSVVITALIFTPAFTGGDSSATGDSLSFDEQNLGKIGDTVEVGGLAYTVDDIYQSKEVEDEYSHQTAQGVYLIAKVTVTNNDKESRTVDTALFELVQKDGTTYTADSGATSIMNGDSSFFLNTINPKIQQTGYVAFDVPASGGEYFLKLLGGMVSTDYKLVSLTSTDPIKEWEPFTEIPEEAQENNAVADQESKVAKAQESSVEETNTSNENDNFAEYEFTEYEQPTPVEETKQTTIGVANTLEDAIKLVENLAPGDYSAFPDCECYDIVLEDGAHYYGIPVSSAFGIGGTYFVKAGTNEIYGSKWNDDCTEAPDISNKVN